MFNALELLLVILAVVVMATGLSRRWRLPAGNRTTGQRADWSALLAMVYLQKRLLARPLVGVAHLCLVWGFTLFFLIVILAQTPLRVPVSAAHTISLLLDMAGLSMIVGALFLLIRRLARSWSKKDLRPPRRTVLPLVLLLVTLFSGFLAEGTRLCLVPDQSVWAAPVGTLFSAFMPESIGFMQLMLRVHLVSVILFVAAVPFTFMRHLASTAVHLLYNSKGPTSFPALINLDQGPLGAATVMDLSEQQLRAADACVSCGRCDEQCPALISGKPLSPRTIMGKIVDQMEACPQAGTVPPMDTFSDDEIWACTTCMACVAHCPAYIRPLDKIIELRRGRVLRSGDLSEEARPVIRNLELYGDVNGKGPSHKADWAMNRHVPHVASSPTVPEVLLWVGCSGAFHPDYQQTTRDLVRLLRAGNIDFAILAQEEFCCGDPARKLGDEALFQKLARHNIALFEQHHIKKIVTLCPHCFNTLGREYSALGCDVEVVPAVKMIEQLIQDGRVALKYPFAKSLVIHDPCYLGRYNGIYEPLRQVCCQVPGVRLEELERSKEHAFCCGGGGGRMWLHETLGENINVLRAKEVVAAGVDAVVTACPYCLTMMKDGVKAASEENSPQVIDIISLAVKSLR